jgi:hypothetical protein
MSMYPFEAINLALPKTSTAMGLYKHQASLVSQTGQSESAFTPPTSRELERQNSLTSLGSRSPIQHQLRMLEQFLPDVESQSLFPWLVHLDLVSEVLRVLLITCHYFPNHQASLRRNIHNESPHRLEIWIKGGTNLDEELDALDQFNTDWLIRQSSKLRQNIIVFVE